MRNAAPRRYAILAPNHFRENAKTAHGVIRYGTDETVAVVDPSCAGMRIRDAVPYLHSDAPIVASVAKALTFGPTALLIGTAPKGGRLPPSWRAEIAAAIAGGLEIVSGLHDMLADDPQFARAALEAGTKIWDVRKPPDVPIFSGAAYDVASPIVLAVGSDCAVGKMTVMLELSRAARSNGREATFVPTGQTGIMIAGWGIAVDRVIADFATGAAEQLVLAAAQHEPSCILVEGQGGINNPAYAPVTLALLFGAAPDALVLVADVRRRHIESFGTPILSYRHLIRAYESLCATVKPAQVVAIALNTHGVDEDAAHSEIARARTETGIFADDVVRFGPEALWAAVERSLVKRAPLRAEMAAG